MQQNDQGRRNLLTVQSWIVFVLPLAVFMLVGSLEPTRARTVNLLGWRLAYDQYPLVYTIKIALTSAAIALVWPCYRRFSFRVTRLGLIVGIVGAAIWIGLAELQLERQLLEPVGMRRLIELGQRSGFNPLVQMADRPALAWAFLAIRFFGLVVVVAVAEEFFLRGFLMRFFVRPDWWNVSFGDVNRPAILVGTLCPVLMHPGEMLAAAVWFSLVTWLMIRTRNIWDCVVAHGLTNLLLGIYVVATGHWNLM